MALSGTLTDLSIVDLVQFPHRGRKSGELVIIGVDGQARLYYDQGNLVHVAFGEKTGMESLVEVLGWSRGEFHFLPGVEFQDDASIEIDLHRAVMLALKTRDEEKRKLEQEQADKASAKQAVQIDRRLNRLLDGFVQSIPFVLHASVISLEGTLAAEAHGENHTPEKDQEIREGILNLIKSYPRAGLDRLFLSDEEGTVAAVNLGNAALVVIADSAASMGALSVRVSRFVSSLTNGDSDDD